MSNTSHLLQNGISKQEKKIDINKYVMLLLKHTWQAHRALGILYLLNVCDVAFTIV